MEYVSIYQRDRSPYWRLSYFDPKQNKRVHRTTKIRVDDALGRRRVLELARGLSQEAIATKPVLDASAWEHWVESYLRLRYGKKAKTLQRAFGAWKCLREWLDERGLQHPSAIEYKHAKDWVLYRTAQKRPNGKLISKNTALCDLKFLNLVLREAVKCGYCAGVPTERHGIQKDEQKVKPEITDEQDQRIRLELVSRGMPQWMHECYEIAMAQGCRLTETQVPLTDVREDLGVITFDAKGDNQFATRLNPALVPLVQRKRAEKANTLTVVPRMAALKWCRFFDEIGLREHSFHCTRVTVITKLARAGVPIQQAIAFVGHASEEIHRIYQRLSPPDLSRAVEALAARRSAA